MAVTSYKTKTGAKLWRVRYRTPDRRQTDKRGFATKKEALAWEADMLVSKRQGAYVSPSAGRITVGELGDARLERRLSLRKASTMHSEESAWRIRVKPRWGDYSIADVSAREVERWIADLSKEQLSTTSMARAHGILSGILDEAVRDRRLIANPAAGVEIPRKAGRRRAYLTHAQVALLADVCSDTEQALIVRTLAYTGIRWGELTGLRARNVDALRQRLHVEESATFVGGAVVVSSPKNGQVRSVPVPVPAHILADLVYRASNRRPDALLFGDGDEHIRPSSSRDGWFTAAARRARELDRTFPTVFAPHDLRHTYASLAIQAGAHAKVLQRALGHSSASMTLNRYADLFDGDGTSVAEALDAALDRFDASS